MVTPADPRQTLFASRNIPADRVAPMLRKHYRFAFVYRWQAVGSAFWTAAQCDNAWHPVVNTVTTFVNGTDDTNVQVPFLQANYTTVNVPANSYVHTNSYRGGAISKSHDALITFIGLKGDGAIRTILPAQQSGGTVAAATALAGTANSNTFQSVQLSSGQYDAALSTQYDDFYEGMISGSEMLILPESQNSACSACLGETRFLQSGYSSSNSSAFAAQGRMDGDSREPLGTDVIVAANVGNVSGFNPNRIQINFLGNINGTVATGGTAAANTAFASVAPSVTQLGGLPAPADGTLAVLDIDLVVGFAFLEYYTDENGQESYRGLTQMDKAAVTKYRETICGQ